METSSQPLFLCRQLRFWLNFFLHFLCQRLSGNYTFRQLTRVLVVFFFKYLFCAMIHNPIISLHVVHFNFDSKETVETNRKWTKCECWMVFFVCFTDQLCELIVSRNIIIIGTHDSFKKKKPMQLALTNWFQTKK